MRGVRLSIVSIPYIPLKEAFRARHLAAHPEVDQRKLPAHHAASNDAIVPSTLSRRDPLRCSVEAVVARPPQRVRHDIQSAHRNYAPDAALNHHSYSKATPARSPRRAAERLAAGIAAPAKAHPHPGAVRVMFHRPRLPAVRPQENLTAPDWDES